MGKSRKKKLVRFQQISAKFQQILANFAKNQQKFSAFFNENLEIRERCKGVHCVDLAESFPISFQIDPNSNAYVLAKFGFDTANNEHLTRTI